MYEGLACVVGRWYPTSYSYLDPIGILLLKIRGLKIGSNILLVTIVIDHVYSPHCRLHTISVLTRAKQQLSLSQIYLLIGQA